MKTWEPMAAGVLELVAGALQLVTAGVVMLLAGGVAAGSLLSHPSCPVAGSFLALIALMGVPLLILGGMSVLGGICALQRRRWGLALAGGICALLPALLMGIVAIVFLVVSRDEFSQARSSRR